MSEGIPSFLLYTSKLVRPDRVCLYACVWPVCCCCVVCCVFFVGWRVPDTHCGRRGCCDWRHGLPRLPPQERQQQVRQLHVPSRKLQMRQGRVVLQQQQQGQQQARQQGLLWRRMQVPARPVHVQRLHGLLQRQEQRSVQLQARRVHVRAVRQGLRLRQGRGQGLRMRQRSRMQVPAWTVHVQRRIVRQQVNGQPE